MIFSIFAVMSNAYTSFIICASIDSEEKFIFVSSEWHYWRHCSRLDSATWLAFLIFHSSGHSRARGAPDVLRANPTVHPHELLRLRRYALNKIGRKIVHVASTPCLIRMDITGRHVIYSTFIYEKVRVSKYNPSMQWTPIRFYFFILLSVIINNLYEKKRICE